MAPGETRNEGAGAVPPEPATLDRLPPVVCPEPVRRAVLVQRWTDAVFVHWPVDPATVQRRLPAGLEVDTFGGRAWVGLVPFRMEGLGFPGLAPLPLVGAFPEVNVRTYVRAGDRRGVWFFSLDVDRSLPVAVARTVFGLPYHQGRVGHDRIGVAGGRSARLVTRVQRRRPGPLPATARLVARPGERLRGGHVTDTPGTGCDPLATFLTARWGLFAPDRRGGLRYAPVEHEPWPLRTGAVVDLDEDLLAAAGLPRPSTPPHVLVSPGVSVRVGRPVPVTPPPPPGGPVRTPARHHQENRP